jgi:hypothetical protein
MVNVYGVKVRLFEFKEEVKRRRNWLAIGAREVVLVFVARDGRLNLPAFTAEG